MAAGEKAFKTQRMLNRRGWKRGCADLLISPGVYTSVGMDRVFIATHLLSFGVILKSDQHETHLLGAEGEAGCEFYLLKAGSGSRTDKKRI